MKKVILIIAILVVGIATAQNKKGEQNENRQEMGQKMMAMSAEQIADLKTKKLSLALNLDVKQQEDIKRFQIEMIQNHKDMMKDRKQKSELTTDELYKMQSARLDAKLKTKQEMKRILNESQYQAWETMTRKKLMARKGGAKRKMAEKRG